MSREEIHKGDIGTKIRMTVKEDDAAVDISTATGKNILYEKPDGTVGSWAGVFETDGSDGKIYYLTALSTDLDVTGEWKIEAEIIMGGGTWRSSIETFQVFKIIE